MVWYNSYTHQLVEFHELSAPIRTLPVAADVTEWEWGCNKRGPLPVPVVESPLFGRACDWAGHIPCSHLPHGPSDPSRHRAAAGNGAGGGGGV